MWHMLVKCFFPRQAQPTFKPAVQGILVNDMRYLASVVTTCFSSFGELLALQKRFAELSGGVVR